MYKARKVYDLMLERACYPDAWCYNILIKGYCRCIVRGWFLILLPTTLLFGVCSLGSLKAAQELLRGQLPDIFTYSTLLDSLCKNQNFVEAMNFFVQMESRRILGWIIVIYHILIDGMCEARKLKLAREIFSSLSNKGLQPNVSTYTTMIDGLCNEGLLDEASYLKEWMRLDAYRMIALIYNY